MSQDKQAGVRTGKPRIHHTVLDRIADSRVGYAPAGLPEEFEVIGPNGNPVASHPISKETPRQREHRTALHDRTRHHVFWRRATYFFLLGLTGVLFFLPFFKPAVPGLVGGTALPLPWPLDALPASWIGQLQIRFGVLENIYKVLFDVLSQGLPSATNIWTDSWTQAPGWFTLCLLGLIGFLAWRVWIDGNIQRLSESGWYALKHGSVSSKKISPLQSAARILGALGAHLGQEPVFNVLARKFLPLVLTYAFGIAAILIITGTAYRLTIHHEFVKDGVCTRPNAVQFTASSMTVEKNAARVEFDTKTPCHDTGFMLEAWQKYKVEVNWNPKWQDLNTPADIRGLTRLRDQLSMVFVGALPARRHLSKPWFALLGEVGADSGYVIPFNRECFVFIAQRRGRLHLYVNDAINAPGKDIPRNMRKTIFENSWDAFYRNNTGEAVVAIKSLSAQDADQNCSKKEETTAD